MLNYQVTELSWNSKPNIICIKMSSQNSGFRIHSQIELPIKIQRLFNQILNNVIKVTSHIPNTCMFYSPFYHSLIFVRN